MQIGSFSSPPTVISYTEPIMSMNDIPRVQTLKEKKSLTDPTTAATDSCAYIKPENILHKFLLLSVSVEQGLFELHTDKLQRMYSLKGQVWSLVLRNAEA